MLKGGRIMKDKDGVVVIGQKPKPEEILAELQGLQTKIPCYGSIKGERSLTGEIWEISINCDNVQLVIAQDRRNGTGKLIKVPETFIVPIAAVTEVWEHPNPFKRWEKPHGS